MNTSELITGVMVLAALVIGVILLIKILAAPLKKIFKFLLNTLLGMGILLLINIIGKNFGVQLEIKPVQCAVAAVFGVPGVLLMVLIKLFF